MSLSNTVLRKNDVLFDKCIFLKFVFGFTVQKHVHKSQYVLDHFLVIIFEADHSHETKFEGKTTE